MLVNFVNDDAARVPVWSVERHHEERVRFLVRQWLDACSPSNFVATNPVVQRAAWSSGGTSFVTGALHWLADQFVQVTGYHRKHAIRVLCREPLPSRTKPGPQRRYDDEVQAALIMLWEAAARICGKRLKALISTLIDSMTRHGHLMLSKGVRQRLNQISAATIDRLQRACANRLSRVNAGAPAEWAMRFAVPIRTFSLDTRCLAEVEYGLADEAAHD